MGPQWSSRTSDTVQVIFDSPATSESNGGRCASAPECGKPRLGQL